MVTSNLLEGELKQRKFLGAVYNICQSSLLTIPVGRISANQAIHSLIGCFKEWPDITLTWDLIVSEVPVLDHTAVNPKKTADTLVCELNAVRNSLQGQKEELIGGIAEVEREIWRATLDPYWDILLQGVSGSREVREHSQAQYCSFFRSDFFSELPFVVISSYLLGYIMNERPVTVNDVVDVYSIAELMPFTALFMTDKDQHNRLRLLQKHYPVLFAQIDELCYISSVLGPESSHPRDVLRSFLEYAKGNTSSN